LERAYISRDDYRKFRNGSAWTLNTGEWREELADPPQKTASKDDGFGGHLAVSSINGVSFKMLPSFP
jgi:hypothetical protein